MTNRSRLYVGYPGGGVFVVTVGEDGKGQPLDPRYDLANHSPDGFAWGYMGSGPAQLALALACDYYQDVELALEHYQEIKRKFVSRLPQNEKWTATTRELDVILVARGDRFSWSLNDVEHH